MVVYIYYFNRCPISGCRNENMLKMSDLVDSKEMANHIADKRRRAGIRTQPSASAGMGDDL